MGTRFDSFTLAPNRVKNSRNDTAHGQRKTPFPIHHRGGAVIVLPDPWPSLGRDGPPNCVLSELPCRSWSLSLAFAGPVSFPLLGDNTVRLK